MKALLKRLLTCLLTGILLLGTTGCTAQQTVAGQEKLTPQMLWINGTYAVLTELNGGDYRLLGGMQATEANKQRKIDSLKESWNITDSASAQQTINWLLTEGHRTEYASLMRSMEQDGYSALSSQALAKALADRFDDADTASSLARSYEQYKKSGPNTIDAWDYCRAVSLCGWYYIAGYYSKQEAYNQSLEIASILQARFSSWDELMDSYFYGYEFWSQESSDERRKVYEKIKQRDDSPYRLDWNLPLATSSNTLPAEDSQSAAAVPQGTGSSPSAAGNSQTVLFEKEFGCYTLPAEWVESSKYSTGQKFFYVLDGTENEMRPNNISVEAGSNRYSINEHEQFRTAILNQMGMQLKGSGATNINGSGSYTAQGELLYTFTVEFPAENEMDTHYYIVGDHRYLLVYETAFGDTTETDRAATSIVNSFVWAEDD